MKKLVTLRNVLKACAVLLGLVAFFLMFGNQIYVKSGNTVSYVEFDKALFGGETLLGDYKGAVISFVGYLLIALAAIAACVLVFLPLDAKIKKFVNLGLGFVLVLGAIFVFIVGAAFNGANGFDSYHAAFCPIFAGILAIIGGLLVCGSEFAPDKQLLK